MPLSRITNPFLGSSGSISTTDNANAALRITQLGTGNALLVEDSTNPDATSFAIDAIGTVLVGTTTAQTIDGITPAYQQLGANNYAGMWLGRYSANNTANYLYLTKSRGTVGTNTIVNSGDDLGTLAFYGADGTNLIPAATILGEVDGTPGTNDMPGRLVFSTTADGASSVTERMRIDSAGLLTLASGQIKFPASQNASADANTLDDYEEGTFTPTAIGGSSAGTTTYTSQSGQYTKIGRLVTARFAIGYSSLTGTGELVISLPFVANGEYMGSIMTNGLNWNSGSGTSLVVYTVTSAATCRIFISGDDISWSVQQCVNEGADFIITVTYFV